MVMLVIVSCILGEVHIWECSSAI